MGGNAPVVRTRPLAHRENPGGRKAQAWETENLDPTTNWEKFLRSSVLGLLVGRNTHRGNPTASRAGGRGAQTRARGESRSRSWVAAALHPRACSDAVRGGMCPDPAFKEPPNAVTTREIIGQVFNYCRHLHVATRAPLYTRTVHTAVRSDCEGCARAMPSLEATVGFGWCCQSSG